MKFDSNLAWQDASATVRANRDVLLAMAGVFFLLPHLVFTLLLPEPATITATSPEAIAEQVEALYTQILPWILPQILLQTIGTLGMLTLFSDQTRPTVGQAIALGAKGTLPYLACQLLFAFTFSLVGGITVGVIALAHNSALTVAAVVAVMGGLIAAYARVALAAPIVAVERIYNPIRVLRRAWFLTRGNTARILGFLVMVIIAATVAMLAATAISGAIAAAVGGKQAAHIATGTLSSIISAVLAVYMSAILAAIHRQLAYPF
jgi:hypothetical protein